MTPIQKFWIIPILGILIQAVLSVNQAAAGTERKTIVLATLDWPPYVGKALPSKGYIAAIVTEAFKRSNIDASIRFHRWSRVIGLARKGEVDGYFPEYYADAIRSWASFSDPIPAGPLGLFRRKGSDIRFTGLKDLIPYRIGIVKGYINSRDFDTAHFLNKHPVNDDLSNFRLLMANRVDLVVADKYVGYYLVKQHMPDQFSKLEFLPRILENKEVHVCIRSGKKASHFFLNAFNRGLREMKADGTLDHLLPEETP